MYPWEGKETPKETFVKSGGFGYIAFGVVFVLTGWLTKAFTSSYGWLFVAYGAGYYAGAEAAFKRVGQGK
jgi:hypothetical protein